MRTYLTGQRHLFKTLRGKLLIAFLAVVLLPFGLVIYLNYKATESALTNAAYNSLFAAASQITVSLDDFVSANLELIETQSKLPKLSEYLSQPVEDHSYDSKLRMAKILQSFANRDRVFISSCALVNMEGRIVADTIISRTGMDISGRDFFSDPLETGRPFASPVEFSQDDKQAYLHFSSPILNKEKLMVGVLYYRYSTAILQQILVRNYGGAGIASFPILLNENHLILAHGSISDQMFKTIELLDKGRVENLQKQHRLPTSYSEKMYIPLPLLSTGLKRVNSPEPFFDAEFLPDDRKKSAGAVTQMKTMPWLVVFLQPQEIFLAPAQSHARKQLYLGAVIAGTVAIFAIAIAQFLSQPISHLTMVTRKVAEGDLSVQIDVESGDEIGALSSAFNTMTNQLRKREEALLKSEERMRLFFERQLAGMAITSPEKGWLQVNDQLTHMLGYSAEELSKLNWAELTHPEDLEADEAQFARLLSGEIDSYALEKRFIRKDGSVIYTNISVGCVRRNDGSLDYVLALLKDTTDRKAAESALQKNEQKFRFIVQHAPAIIFILDMNGEFLLSEGQALSRISLTPGEVVGVSAFEIYKDYPKICASIKMALRGEQTRITTELEKIAFDIVYGPYYDAVGLQIGVIGIAIDVTERKKLEEQLIQAQKMESVGRLAGGVAHDFNNMLSVILGHAELAMEQLNPAQPIFANLQQIRQAANRSADITRQLLAFARKQVIAPKVIDLNETVAGMLKMLLRLIGEDIDLAWLPGKGLWPIKIDPSQIDQILANLCVNARDAISGVGKITVETENCTFDEEYCSVHSGFVSGEYLEIGVSDNGSGMDKETVSHIFEPFFTTKGVNKGTGLGMATVYGIVKQNNGFINVYSEQGQGTTIKIYLPRHVGTKNLEQVEFTAKPDARGNETILLVEDESTILKMTTTLLQLLGYAVLTAGTPIEAIRLAGEYSGEIHLLLTDVIMPGMNGRVLTEKLIVNRPEMKCLFMSGYSANVITQHGVLDDGVYFIQKPFAKRELAAKIRQALGDG